MQHILLNFVFMHTAVQKFQFFVFMRNFVENLLFISNELRYFVQNWFRIDTKMMRNFVQKSHFLQNHTSVAQEY